MGPKFFQTGMGKKFFEGDFPRLVRVLERIAKSLEQEKARKDPLYVPNFNTTVQRDAAEMMESGPLMIGQLTLKSSYPDADDLTITVGGQEVVISKDENGDVYVAVDKLFTVKLGESFSANSEP